MIRQTHTQTHTQTDTHQQPPRPSDKVTVRRTGTVTDTDSAGQTDKCEVLAQHHAKKIIYTYVTWKFFKFCTN